MFDIPKLLAKIFAIQCALLVLMSPVVRGTGQKIWCSSKMWVLEMALLELSRASGKKILEKKPEEENLVTLYLYADVIINDLADLPTLFWTNACRVPIIMVLLAFIHSSAYSMGKKGCNLGVQENENDMVVQRRFSFMRKQTLSYVQWMRQKRPTIGPGSFILETSRKFAKLLLMTYSSRSTFYLFYDLCLSHVRFE